MPLALPKRRTTSQRFSMPASRADQCIRHDPTTETLSNQIVVEKPNETSTTAKASQTAKQVESEREELYPVVTQTATLHIETSQPVVSRPEAFQTIISPTAVPQTESSQPIVSPTAVLQTEASQSVLSIAATSQPIALTATSRLHHAEVGTDDDSDVEWISTLAPLNLAPAGGMRKCVPSKESSIQVLDLHSSRLK